MMEEANARAVTDNVKGSLPSDSALREKHGIFAESVYNSFLTMDDCFHGNCPWKEGYEGILGLEISCPVPYFIGIACPFQEKGYGGYSSLDFSSSDAKLDFCRNLEFYWRCLIRYALAELSRMEEKN